MTVFYSGQKQYPNWRCRHAYETKEHAPNSLSDARAQAEVLSWLERESRGGDDIDAQAKRHAEALAIEDEVGTRKRQLDALIAKRKRLSNAWTDGKIDEEDHLEQWAQVKTAQAEAAALLAAAEARAATSGSGVLRAFGYLRDEWPRLTAQGRNQALRKVIRLIRINPGPYGPRKVEIESAWS